MKIKKFLDENNLKYQNWLVNNDYGGIDIKILKYLENIENGVFIEAGAHDGVFQSTTKILEDLGWTGLLIEPSEFLYKKCKNNRTSISENYALVSFNYNQNTIKGDWIGNLILENNGITLMGDKDEVCQVSTLTELCKKHNIYDVDFFSLDVEGYELEALDGVDFNLINIKYCLIEWNKHKYTIENLINYMENKNFELVCNLSNFTKENSPSWPETHQDYLFKNKKI
jgi:FkbM family methyltransferase